MEADIIIAARSGKGAGTMREVWSLITTTDNIHSLLVLCAAGELHPRERALRDGGNKENCSAHPDSCHAGDGNQSAEPISRADPQTDRRGDPGKSGQTSQNREIIECKSDATRWEVRKRQEMFVLVGAAGCDWHYVERLTISQLKYRTQRHNTDGT